MRQRLDQVVLLVAQQKHVARRQEDLPRHVEHVADVEDGQQGDAAIDRAAALQRRQHQGRTVGAIGYDRQRPAGADQRAVSGDGAGQQHDDDQAGQVVVRHPEEEPKRCPSDREQQICGRRDQDRPFAVAFLQGPRTAMRHERDGNAGDDDDGVPQDEPSCGQPSMEHDADHGGQRRHHPRIGAKVAQRQAELVQRELLLTCAGTRARRTRGHPLPRKAAMRRWSRAG